MDVSPTLGRWQFAVAGRGSQSAASGETVGGGHGEGGGDDEQDEGGEEDGNLPVEDLNRNVIEVSGLRLAIDLCAEQVGGRPGVRFLMM